MAVIKDGGEGRPCLEHVIHGLCDIAVLRELRAVLAHPSFQIGHQRGAEFLANGKAILRRPPVDGAFNVEDHVDTADSFHRQRGDDRRLLASLLELGGDIGQLQEIAARMAPAQRAGQRCWKMVGLKQRVIPCIGIGLKYAGPVP